MCFAPQRRVVAFEIELATKAPKTPAALPILSVPTASRSARLRELQIDCAWRYPNNVKDREIRKNGSGELKLTPRWDSFAGEVGPSWCLEATAFCVLGEQTCSLPFDKDMASREGSWTLSWTLAIPNLVGVKVLLTVWDEVVLRVCRSAFFGQAWLPPITALGQGKLELPLLHQGEVGELLLEASWKYPAGPESNLESQGSLTLKNLVVRGVNGPAYLEVRVLHQCGRGVEGAGDHQLTLPISIPKAGSKPATNPARLKPSDANAPVLKVATPRPRSAQLPRFVAPGSLVKLGRRLRFLGFDVRLVESVPEASAVAENEQRHLLLLQGSRIRGSSGACAVPRSSLEEQLQFTLDHLGILLDPALMASRCAECNADKFRLASAEEVSSELHASTIERYSEFWRCCSCRKLYWEGGAWCRSMRAAGAAWTGGPTGEEKCGAGAAWAAGWYWMELPAFLKVSVKPTSSAEPEELNEVAVPGQIHEAEESQLPPPLAPMVSHFVAEGIGEQEPLTWWEETVLRQPEQVVDSMDDTSALEPLEPQSLELEPALSPVAPELPVRPPSPKSPLASPSASPKSPKSPSASPSSPGQALPGQVERLDAATSPSVGYSNEETTDLGSPTERLEVPVPKKQSKPKAKKRSGGAGKPPPPPPKVPEPPPLVPKKDLNEYEDEVVSAIDLLCRQKRPLRQSLEEALDLRQSLVDGDADDEGKLSSFGVKADEGPKSFGQVLAQAWTGNAGRSPAPAAHVLPWPSQEVTHREVPGLRGLGKPLAARLRGLLLHLERAVALDPEISASDLLQQDLITEAGKPEVNLQASGLGKFPPPLMVAGNVEPMPLTLTALSSDEEDSLAPNRPFEKVSKRFLFAMIGMLPRVLKFLSFTSLAGFVSSASVKNCGGPNDHFSNVSLDLSPDPISRATPFTFTLTGSMDEDHVGGTVDVDLEIKALRVVDKTVKTQSSYTISPGLVKGPQKLVIGPVTLPQDPGEASLKGQVSVTNTKGEPVACVALDIEVPLFEEEAQRDEDYAGVKSCGSATDHLKHVSETTSGDVTTVTGTLDEDLTSITANVDVTVHALFVKVPLKLQIPMSFSPAISKGDWKLTTREDKAVAEVSGSPVKVEGQVVIDDAKKEQVTCVSISSDTSQIMV
eukprot:s79_g37.t1